MTNNDTKSSRAQSRDLGQRQRDASTAVGMTEKLAVGMTEKLAVGMTEKLAVGMTGKLTVGMTGYVVSSAVEKPQAADMKGNLTPNPSTSLRTGSAEASLVERLSFLSFRPHRLVSSRAQPRDLGQRQRDASTSVGMTEKLVVGMTGKLAVGMTGKLAVGMTEKLAVGMTGKLAVGMTGNVIPSAAEESPQSIIHCGSGFNREHSGRAFVTQVAPTHPSSQGFAE